MEHEQFDEALMQCIHTLRAGSDMDHAIQNLLEIIAEFHDADRAYIFEFAEDEIHMDNTYVRLESHQRKICCRTLRYPRSTGGWFYLRSRERCT
jgi:GAF domain-containing protein